ncbi:MAG: anaerobic ribonucleoside-triphosphate reductase activating protein [Sulfurimicrobium sp.]|nr:anaerobic ribonucleoside-triphosphate reductase activating protein [Sulfurimicrobium sp.]
MLPKPASLQVGGLTPLTTTDFPGLLAAVVFCQGCPWQCGYCHNPHLIPRGGEATRNWAEVMAFLHRRQGLLDAVVFSGGEPTLQSGLADACREARELGFKIGLHTAGTYPERLAEILPSLDWVGMDIKAPFADYDRTTGVPGSGERARESLLHLLDSGVDYEIRTTLHPDLMSEESIVALARELAALGVRHFVLQQFRAQGCADPVLCQAGSRDISWAALREEIEPQFQHFSIRSA